jgi:hypothetical protein
MAAVIENFQLFYFHLPAVILPDIISGGLSMSTKPWQCNKYSSSEGNTAVLNTEQHWMIGHECTKIKVLTYSTQTGY